MDWFRILGLERRVRGWRRLAAETAAAAEDRFELFTIEWQEEKRRFARMVVLGVLVAALAIVTLTVVSMALMVQFWDSGYRTQAAWCVAGVWVLVWAGLLISLYQTAKASSAAFPVTREELARDWAELKEHL